MMEQWKSKTLGDNIKILSGFAFDADHFTNGEGIPLIRIRDLAKEKTEVNYNGFFKDDYVVKNGDLLVGMDGEFHTVLWKGKKALLNQRVCKLTTLDENMLDQTFLFYRIISEIRKINEIVAATTVKHLSIKDINKINIKFPSKTEQTRIAEILSTADAAIAETEALIAKYQRIKTGLMQDLLTRGIDEQGNIRSEETHRFVVKKGVRVPEEWDIIELSEIRHYITSGSRNWAQYYSAEGALFVRITNLTREHINFRFDDIKRVNVSGNVDGLRTKLEKDDILISITADLGIIGVIPDDFEEAYINQHVCLFKILDADNFHPRFVGHYLQSQLGQHQFEQLNDGGAKKGLNLPTILKLKVPEISLNEQNKIVEILDRTDKTIEKHKAQLMKTQSLKSGLMQDLLSGRVRV
jgi:type I restriction enzyme, S subunit